MDVRDYGGEFNPILGLMSRAIVSFAGIVVLSSRFYARFFSPLRNTVMFMICSDRRSLILMLVHA